LRTQLFMLFNHTLMMSVMSDLCCIFCPCRCNPWYKYCGRWWL